MTAIVYRVFLSLLVCLALAAQADPRQQFTAESPAWLSAVGKLTVPGQRFEQGERLHHREDCTATLIGAQTILTAWHCLEYYGDVSHDILFKLDGESRLAYRLAEGGGMRADWAVLQLDRPISDVIPVPVRMEFDARVDTQVSIAGYSRDDGLGAGGTILTWQSACTITDNEGYRVATNCLAYKGASGGPTLFDGAIIGVISAGDGQGQTYYAPSSSFRSAVRLHRQ